VAPRADYKLIGEIGIRSSPYDNGYPVPVLGLNGIDQASHAFLVRSA